MSVSNDKTGRKYKLYMVRAIYLGSEPMGELLDGENGSDAVQVPLKRTILRTDGVGDEVDLMITDESLCINFIKDTSFRSGESINKPKTMLLPIESLAYCGALRQLPPNKVRDREFETLDKAPNDPKIMDPPLFVAIFRSSENQNTLLCHSFVTRKDIEAMELVQNVMEVYYNVVGQSSENGSEKSDYKQRRGVDTPSSTVNITEYFNDGNTYTTSKNNLTKADLDRLLEAYNRTKINDKNNTTSILNNQGSSQFATINTSGNVSAKDIIKGTLDPNKYEIIDERSNFDGRKSTSSIDYSNIPLNQDDDPIVIKKQTDEPLIYKQNVYIRWLQPPTPPPPAPIIIREVPAPAPPEQPPLVIYKKPPREKTPPPLIIREKPPTPITPTEPLIIERQVPAIEQKPRRVVVEQLPAPPSKPRDIILEKWLPREQAKRPVIVEKASHQSIIGHKNRYRTNYTTGDLQTYEYRPSYQYQGGNYAYQGNTNYEVVERSQVPAKRIIRHVIRPGTSYFDGPTDNYRQRLSPIPAYPNQIYSTNHVNNIQRPQVTGYRIIRQIIPGPNATAGDIERALARSQYLGANAYSRHRSRVYSPIDNIYRHRKYSHSPPRYDHYQKPAIKIEEVYAPHRSRKIHNVLEESTVFRSASLE